MNDLNYYGNWALWAAFLAFAIVFALLFKKDKVLGIAGATVMVISILLNMFPLPCGYIAIDLCWIALCAAVLWRLRQSSFDKPFIKKLSKKVVLFGHSGKIRPTQRAETQFFADFCCG